MTPETREAIECAKRALKRAKSEFARSVYDGVTTIVHCDHLVTLIEAVEALEPRPIPEPPKLGAFGGVEPPYNGKRLVLIWDRPLSAILYDVAFWHSAHRRWCRLHEFACNQHPESQPTHFIPLSALPQPEAREDK